MRYQREQQLQAELEAAAAPLEAELAVGGLRGMRDYVLGRRKFGNRAEVHRQLTKLYVDIELSKMRIETELTDKYSPYKCPGPVPTEDITTETLPNRPARCAITHEAL